MRKTRYNIFKRSLEFIVTLTLLLTVNLSSDAEEIFAPLTKMNDVQSSYVSGRYLEKEDGIFNFVGRTIDLGKGLSAVYSYVCTSAESINEARNILDDYLKKNPEMELEMKKEGYSVQYRVYERYNRDNERTQMIIWQETSGITCSIAVIYWKDGAKD